MLAMGAGASNWLSGTSVKPGSAWACRKNPLVGKGAALPGRNRSTRKAVADRHERSMRKRAHLARLCAFGALMFLGLRICILAASQAFDFSRTIARHTRRFDALHLSLSFARSARRPEGYLLNPRASASASGTIIEPSANESEVGCRPTLVRLAQLADNTLAPRAPPVPA